MAKEKRTIGTLKLSKRCAKCNKRFVTVWPREKYCSDECRYGTGTCIVCGKSFVKKKGTTGDYCSLVCWYVRYKQIGKEIKTCPNCGKEFHGSKVTCSKQCAYEWRRKRHPSRKFNCTFCGKPLIGKKPRVKFCSLTCAMKFRNKHGGHTLPDGSKYIDGSGYVHIKVNGRWLMEHRQVMEKKLGRPLQPWERVHHKNGERAQNQPENLELWTLRHKDPPGVRVSDVPPHCPTCTCHLRHRGN